MKTLDTLNLLVKAIKKNIPGSHVDIVVKEKDGPYEKYDGSLPKKTEVVNFHVTANKDSYLIAQMFPMEDLEHVELLQKPQSSGVIENIKADLRKSKSDPVLA